MRKVRDIMSAAPVCMAPGESVSAAARAMKQHGIGTVLVLTDGRLSGLVTDRDITVRVLAENRDPRTTPIGDICSSELVVLGPDDDLAQASRLVRDHAVRRIPVLRTGRRSASCPSVTSRWRGRDVVCPACPRPAELLTGSPHDRSQNRSSGSCSPGTGGCTPRTPASGWPTARAPSTSCSSWPRC